MGEMRLDIYKHKNTGIAVVKLKEDECGNITYMEYNTKSICTDRNIFFNAVYEYIGDHIIYY